MDKIYQEILEAIELKKEIDTKIAELERKIGENLAKGQEFNNRTFSVDKDSVEYQVELREKQKMDIESDKMKTEKQSLENEVSRKVDTIKSGLENMIAQEKHRLETNERYRQSLINSIEERKENLENAIRVNAQNAQDKVEQNENMKLWNDFYGEELFSDTFDEKKYMDNVERTEKAYTKKVEQKIGEIEERIILAESESASILDNIKKMESVYNQLSSKDIEELAEEASKNIGNLKIEEPTTAKQQENNENQGEHMNKSQEEHIKATRMRICKDVFSKMEKGFEDLLTPEYRQSKDSILSLVYKDPDQLRKIMYEINSMSLEDIYEEIINAVKKQGKEDKAKNLAKNLEKIKARREELNPTKDETKKDETKKDEAKKDETKKDEAKKDETKKDEAKKDEAKKDEAKKDEAKKDETKKDETKKDEAKKDETKKEETKKDETKKDEAKKVKPYEKTTIEVDTQHNIIVICAKGKTEPYRVSNSDDIKQFIKNGKEYKNDKEYKKLFDKKALKKVDPVLLGILVDVGDMDAAKEYVNAFKNENATSIELKYTFGEYYDVSVPMRTISNYERFAKKAQKSADATVEGLKKGPIGRFMDWRNARKAKKLEAAKEGKPTFGEKVQTYLFDEFGEERDEKIAEYKKSKQKLNVEHVDVDHEKAPEDDGKKAGKERPKEEKRQENEPKKDFKDEMKKDAPTPEEQAKTAKEFGEKEKQNGKATRRERKSLGTKETEK